MEQVDQVERVDQEAKLKLGALMAKEDGWLHECTKTGCRMCGGAGYYRHIPPQNYKPRKGHLTGGKLVFCRCAIKKLQARLAEMEESE